MQTNPKSSIKYNYWIHLLELLCYSNHWIPFFFFNCSIKVIIVVIFWDCICLVLFLSYLSAKLCFELDQPFNTESKAAITPSRSRMRFTSFQNSFVSTDYRLYGGIKLGYLWCLGHWHRAQLQCLQVGHCFCLLHLDFSLRILVYVPSQGLAALKSLCKQFVQQMQIQKSAQDQLNHTSNLLWIWESLSQFRKTICHYVFDLYFVIFIRTNITVIEWWNKRWQRILLCKTTL